MTAADLADVFSAIAERVGPKPDIGDLVGLPEIARMFGVRPPTPYRWRDRGIMPEPDWTVSGSPIWRRAVIVAWGEETGRAIVPPPKPRRRRKA